jgi:hypothetical protein
MALLLDSLSGSSKLLLYKARQSASLVKDATVRMEPAASQANCAESEWAFLFF